MSIVALSNIEHSFGAEKIFSGISFSLEHNSRIGLVGKNGSGKTTLLNIMTSKMKPDNGDVHKAKKAMIAYLTQEPILDESLSLRECVLASRKDYIFARKNLQQAELDLAEQRITIDKFSVIQQNFELLGGYNFQTEMKLVLTSLQFPLEVWDRKIALFSGGEKTRIQLATILLQPYDLLLLDEPTNHLDIEMIYWLEKYLSNIDKPYLIISHDRHFLDNTVSKIVEINNFGLDVYNGNFSSYREQRIARIELLQKTAKKQQKKIDKMKKQIDQYRIWGRARDSEVMFKRAKELEKRLAKIERIETPPEDKELDLHFGGIDRSGNDVYTFEDMSFGFKDNVLAKNVNLQIFYQDKIAILGKNGCGKTTFLKLINRKIKPLKGIAKIGASLEIGYYDQMHIELDESLTVKESIWQLEPMAGREFVFSYLAKYGFIGDEIEKKISVLSGGEKARLYLAILIHQKPNFLILDEPTNHLDINMISYLEDALSNFKGTIVFVSHDRYFIEKIATRKWMFQNDSIEEVKGKLDELFFQKEIKQKGVDNRKPKQRKTNPLILEKLESELESNADILKNKQQKLSELELKFSDPITYDNPKKLKELTLNINVTKDEISKLQKEIEKLEDEYLGLVD